MWIHVRILLEQNYILRDIFRRHLDSTWRRYLYCSIWCSKRTNSSFRAILYRYGRLKIYQTQKWRKFTIRPYFSRNISHLCAACVALLFGICCTYFCMWHFLCKLEIISSEIKIERVYTLVYECIQYEGCWSCDAFSFSKCCSCFDDYGIRI